MEHFKKFLIRLQTFNINLTTRKKNADSYPHNTREVQYFDLSHENPDLSRSFKSEVKELSNKLTWKLYVEEDDDGNENIEIK